MNHLPHVDGFKNTQEVLQNFLETQIQTATDEDRPFWEATAERLNININDDPENVDYKTVIARVIYNPRNHKFLGYRVEDTDDVHVNVGDNPFEYASELFQRGYILVNAACYDFDGDGKPLTIVFRFAAYR